MRWQRMTDWKSCPTLLFDVNETLLDIRPLERDFARWFGDPAAMRIWFGQLVLHSQSLTLAGEYRGFGDLAKAVLTMLAETQGKTLPDDAGEHLIARITALSPHDDVVPALERLRAAGYRLGALTNSSADALESQMRHAGLAELLPFRMSVEACGRYKPDPAPYRAAAAALGQETGDILMVACHGWDTLGAAAAGLRAAFISRPGCAQIELPGINVADVALDGLAALADALCGPRQEAGPPG